MRHRTQPELVGNVIDRDRGLNSGGPSPIAARDWEGAVGTRIAARAKPQRLEEGVLSIRVATSAWCQELTLLSSVILDQLRARGIQVEALRFRVGPVEKPSRGPYRNEVRKAPPSVELPLPVKKELANIADDELRDVIARAASRNLGWQAELSKEKKASKK